MSQARVNPFPLNETAQAYKAPFYTQPRVNRGRPRKEQVAQLPLVTPASSAPSAPVSDLFRPKPSLTKPTSKHTAADAHQWVTTQLARGKTERFFEEANLTPAMAEALIFMNTRNRALRPARVARYVRDMLDGRWILTAENIAISTEGLLNDGQHRLHACVESGVSIPMTLAWGRNEKEFEKSNTGLARDAKDHLHAERIANPQVLAPMASLLLRVEGKYPFNATPSADVISEKSKEMGALGAEAVTKGMQAACRTPATSAALAYYVIKSRTKQPTEKLDTFWDEFVTGVVTDERSPVPHLHLFLQDALAKGSSRQIAFQRAAAIIFAYTTYCKKSKRKRFPWSVFKSFPEVA